MAAGVGQDWKRCYGRSPTVTRQSRNELCFKCPISNDESGDESTFCKTLISEIMILSHQSVRDHDNITKTGRNLLGRFSSHCKGVACIHLREISDRRPCSAYAL